MDVVELTEELVGIESVSGREGRVAQHFAARLEGAGWTVVRQGVEGGDPALPPRVNVLAIDGPVDPGRGPRLVFTTHLDTVPPFIAPRVEGGFVYGRGTCDAKGILAAQWIALEALRERGHRGLGLLGVVGEETTSIGAKVVQAILPKAGFIVDGEPTRLVMTSAAKGILVLRVSAQGVAGHSAYPERGQSAVHALMRGLVRLIEAELPSQPEFGATTVNVGLLEGGLAANVIAPAASSEVVVRLAASLPAIEAEVRRILGPELDVEVASASEPLRIHVPEGYRGEPVSFGSDVPYLSQIAPTSLVGPGSIHDAHTAGERIGEDELRAAVDYYIALGERLLGGVG
jgi:acetylornithine deacetylase